MSGVAQEAWSLSIDRARFASSAWTAILVVTRVRSWTIAIDMKARTRVPAGIEKPGHKHCDRSVHLRPSVVRHCWKERDDEYRAEVQPAGGLVD